MMIMNMEQDVQSYYLGIPLNKEVVLKRGQEIDENGEVGQALIKYYPEDVIIDGVPYLGSGGADVIPAGLTDTQAKDAIYAAHVSKTAIENIEGMVSNGSEIDGKYNVNNNTIVIDGDSICRQNTHIDSTTSLTQSAGYFIWGNTLLGNKLKLIANNGVGGERTDQLLLRLQLSIDLKPRFLNVNIGKNDISQNIDIQTIKNNLLEIYTRIKKAGIICILNNIIPYGTSDLDQINAIYGVNEYLRQLQETKNDLIVCDMYSSIVDPATNISFTDYLVSDNIHPSVIGAYFMGEAFRNSIEKYIPNIVLFQGSNGTVDTNIINNSFMLGGTTTATGWSFYVSSGVGVTSKVRRDKGLEWQQAEMTTFGEASFYQSIYSNFQIGDKYKFIAEYELDSNVVQVDSYRIELLSKDSEGVNLFSVRGLDIGSSTMIRFPQAITSGVIETPELEITADTYRIIPYLKFKLLGKIRFGRTRLIKTN